MSDVPEVSVDTGVGPVSTPIWRHPLTLIVVVGIVFRLYDLAGLSLWYDESTTLIGTKYVDWKLTFLSSGESRLQPLNSVLTFFWVMFGTNVLGIEMGSVASDFFLRFLPAVYGVGLIFMTYVLSMRLFENRKAALVGAWFIALSPFHVYYAQEFRPHTLYALLVTIGMYCSLRALEGDGKRYWYFTAIAGALAFYTYYFSALYFLAINVFALSCFTRYRSKIVPWTMSQLSILVLIIPPVLMALTVWGMHTGAEEHWFPHPTWKTALLTLKNLFAGYSYNIPLYWALFFIGSGILCLGLIESRKFPYQAKFILCLSAFPILFQIVFWSTQDFAFYTYRIQLAFTVPIYILMGIGICSIPIKAGRIALVALFSILTLPALNDVYTQNLHPVWNHVIGARYKVDSRSAAKIVKENWSDGDVLAHSSTFSYSPFREHYFLDEDQRILAFSDEEFQLLLKSYPEEKMWRTIGFVPQRIENVVAGKKRVWYVQSDWDPFNQSYKGFEFRAWLDAHGTRLANYSFDGINVYLFDMAGDTEMGSLEFRRFTNGRDHVDEIMTPETKPTRFDDSLLLGNRSLIFSLFPGGTPEVMNIKNVPIHVTGIAYSALDIVPTIAFERELDSTAWRPFSSFYNQPSMRAELTDESESVLRIDRKLPSGKLNVFLRIQLDTELENSVAGRIQIEISQGDVTLLSHTAAPKPDHGWYWHDAGVLQSVGGAMTLTLKAFKGDATSSATIDCESIAFVAPDGVEQFLNPDTFEVDAAPNATTPISVMYSGVQSSGRINIEFQDEDENGYTLFYHR